MRAPPPPTPARARPLCPLPPSQPHLSLEHYVRVSATTVQLARTATRAPAVVHAHQFVGTTHAHRKEHVPAVIVSYEVSALHVQLTEVRGQRAHSRGARRGAGREGGGGRTPTPLLGAPPPRGGRGARTRRVGAWAGSAALAPRRRGAGGRAPSRAPRRAPALPRAARARHPLTRRAARPAPQERVPVSQLLLSLCAIVGGVVSIFGLLDGLVHASGRAIKRVAL